MATATLGDLSRLDAILRDRPLVDSLQEAYNKATPFAEKITQQLTLSGRKGIFPVSFGANEGTYARSDKGTFGDSQVDAPSLAEVHATFLYAIFNISGPTMSATRDSVGAFEDALALELEKTVDGAKLDMARQIIGFKSGIIGLVKSRTSTTEFLATSPFGLADYKSDRPIRNIIRKGMEIDVRTVSTGALQAMGAITAITQNATTSDITIDTVESGTIAASNELYRQGNKGYELNGFLEAVQTTGTYLAVVRTGLPGWQGCVTDAAGGGTTAVALDPDMLRDMADTIMETSGKTPDLIVANYKQRRNIYNLYAPQIRYAPMVLPAGMRENTLAFDDTPILAERFFPPEHIGFVNTGTWYHAIDKDVEWIQGLNGTVLHFTLTSDVFLAVLRTYRNLACLYPAANGLLYGLTE